MSTRGKFPLGPKSVHSVGDEDSVTMEDVENQGILAMVFSKCIELPKLQFSACDIGGFLPS